MPWARRASSPKVRIGLLPPRAIARPSSRSISVSATPSVRAASATTCAFTLSPAIIRIPSVDGLPAGEGADALADRIGVAGGHHDILDPAADPVSDDLREHRVRTLALRGGA